jgi:small GTP-binding protein
MPGPNANIFKIVIVGSAEVGKTSFLEKAVSNNFISGYKATIGVDFKIASKISIIDEPTITKNDKDVLQVWDTAGQVRFASFGPSIYREVVAIILMTDLNLWSNNQSSNIVTEKQKLNKEIQNICEAYPGNDLPLFYLVGTKHDIATTDNIQAEALKNLTQYANEIRIRITDETGLPENHVFITTSKDKVDDSNNTSQLKSPARILNTIYTHLKKLEQAKAPTEEGTQTPGSSHVSRDSSIPTHIPSGYNSLTISRIVRARTSYPPEIRWPNRLLGALFGALLGALMGIIIHNPVTCFLAAWRAPDWSEWGIANFLRIYIFAPLFNPPAAMVDGFLSGGVFGAEEGVRELLQIPKDMAEPFKLRTIITGLALSIFIGAAVVVALFHLIPLALPIILGVAGAAALVTVAGYEGIDYLLTQNELQETIKDNAVAKPLLAAERSSFELKEHFNDDTMLASSITSSRTSRTSRTYQDNSFMAVNVYEKAHNARSWCSWFQVTPETAEPLIDYQPTGSSVQITRL